MLPRVRFGYKEIHHDPRFLSHPKEEDALQKAREFLATVSVIDFAEGWARFYKMDISAQTMEQKDTCVVP